MNSKEEQRLITAGTAALFLYIIQDEHCKGSSPEHIIITMQAQCMEILKEHEWVYDHLCEEMKKKGAFGRAKVFIKINDDDEIISIEDPIRECDDQD